MCRSRYFLSRYPLSLKGRTRGNWFPMRGCFLVQTELWSDRKHFCSYISFNWIHFLFKVHLDYDQFTAITIYFTQGLAQVYNISDHSFVRFVAILELLTSDRQRFLNQSRMCLYNLFITICQRWLNWNIKIRPSAMSLSYVAFLSLERLFYFVQVLFMSRTTVFYKAKQKALITYIA